MFLGLAVLAGLPVLPWLAGSVAGLAGLAGKLAVANRNRGLFRLRTHSRVGWHKIEMSFFLKTPLKQNKCNDQINSEQKSVKRFITVAAPLDASQLVRGGPRTMLAKTLCRYY